jgi:2-polyprenyl-3-methyl-5-hydroxy-6-metoxy-1,4-benzoquinol methylase
MPDRDLTRVSDAASDLYGEAYWFAHQANDLGYPTITERARADLSERCLYWLRALLRHKLPSGSIVELGAAHGGFVALLRQAGFEASGQELSPAIVEFASSTFDIPMFQGSIEDQNVPPGSFDVIALLDVMEHFQNPVRSMRHCMSLLKPHGFLLVQTPRAPHDATFEDLVARQDPFLSQLKKDEHLYLFTEQGVREFFRQVGAPEVAFMPAIYAHYDMFLTASRETLPTFSDEDVAAALCGASQRTVLALLDLYAQHERTVHHLAEVERDREARLQLINTLDARLRAIEKRW